MAIFTLVTMQTAVSKNDFESLVNSFVESRRSPFTRKLLLNSTRYAFGDRQGLLSFLALASRDHFRAENQLIEFVSKQTAAKLKGCTIANRLKMIKSLTDSCGLKKIDWRRVHSFAPRAVFVGTDRAATLPEIRSLYSQLDTRGKSLLSLLLSGLRVGGIASLKVKDLEFVEDGEHLKIGKLKVYSWEPDDEYTTFISSEGVKNFEAYFSERKRAGEALGPSSPLLRDKFEPDAPKPAHHMTREGLNSLMKDWWTKVGLNKREFHLFHGMRKFVATALKMDGMNPVCVEMLLGHRVFSNPLDKNYFKPSDEAFLEEFSKHQRVLFLEPSEALKQELEEAKKQKEAVATQYYVQWKKTEDVLAEMRQAQALKDAQLVELLAKLSDRVDRVSKKR